MSRSESHKKSGFLDSSDSDSDSLSEIDCKVCKKSFVNARAFEQHLKSKKHYNKLAERRVTSKQISSGNVELSDSDDENSKFTELHCEDCSMTFSGYKSYVAHIHGSTHAKNLKKKALKEEFKDRSEICNNTNSDDDLVPKPVAKCLLCEKEFMDLGAFKQHLSSALHTKKTKQQKIMELFKAEHDGEVEGDFFRKCDVCDKSFSGLQPYNVHMKSFSHQRSLKRIEAEKAIQDKCVRDIENSKYICKECENGFPDPFSFQLHLDNNSHAKYEAKKKIRDLVESNPDIVAAKTIQRASDESDGKDDYGLGDYILVCKLCHVSFTGPESAVSHLKSKKHLNVKQEKILMKQLKSQKYKKTPTEAGHQRNGDTNKQGETDDFEVL